MHIYIYLYIYIYIYISIYTHSDVKKTIQCAHPLHHRKGFVVLPQKPTCYHKAIVVIRRMDALDCLHV